MLYENFISKDEQENLICWAYKEECRLRINKGGPYRFSNKVKKLSDNKLVFSIL